MLNKQRIATVIPVLGLAIIASAQTGTSTTGAQGATQRETTPAQAGSNMTRLTLVSANDVVGMKVTNQQGEQLGKIEDVIVHPRGDIAYAVLSLSDGDAGKMYTIPWSVLQMHGAGKGADATTGESRSIVLPVEKARLKTAPSFAKGQWPDMKSPEWSRDVDQFYAADRRSTGRAVEASAARTMGQPIWRSSELKGAKVETATGDNLGDVKEVIIDQNGRVSYVVLSVGGFLGMGDRHVAVPFEALKPAATGKSFTLATTKDRLKEAPEFKSGRENWSAMTDSTYVGRVYEFYSIRPYWNAADVGGTGGDRGTGGSGGGGS